MEIGELSPQLMDAFMKILAKHLELTQVNLEKDKVLFPILAFLNKDYSVGQVSPLQPPMATQINPEASLDAAIHILGNSYFDKALFSCSTKIKVGDAEAVEAIKTVIFDASRVAVTFYTPYQLKGLVNKTVTYSRNISSGVMKNFFERK